MARSCSRAAASCSWWSTSIPASPAAASASKRSRLTEEFRPHVLAILRENAGRLDADDLMLELEIRLEDVNAAMDALADGRALRQIIVF